MLIYGALLSPFVRKVCLAAEEKGIAYASKPAGPGSDNPGFLQASPFGKIPALRDGDFTLADSSAIIAYMDAKHPEPVLIPAAAEARGRVIWFDEYADTILAGAGLKVLFHRLVGPKLLKKAGDERIAAEGEAELPRIFDYLESACGEGWLVDDSFSLADIAVASQLRALEYVEVAPHAEPYPAITAWYARVRARPSWQTLAVAETALREKLGL
ncbi:MAG: glutathione S-transferase family protein [Sphingomonadales bacterium]|nr:glutathione S-transferase family protein [Sphingomonadales bacterium]